MTIDTQALIYDPIYDHFGVECTLQLGDGSSETVDVVCIDETRGVMLAGHGVAAGTIVPACSVRVQELTDNEVTLEQLDGGQATFNDKTWNIEAVKPKPSEKGVADGEVYLVLSEETL